MTPRLTDAIRLLLLLPILSCVQDPGSEAESEVTIRVEDGVTIVENPGLKFADSTSWSIDPEPMLELGELKGPSEYLFGRVVGVANLPDGGILVADGQTMQLRIFDAEGGFVRTVGRRGEGPGEFFEMSGAYPATGDSLIVLNSHGVGAHLLDPGFNFVRRTRPRLSRTGSDPSSGSNVLSGVFGDGRLLMGEFSRVCEFGTGVACGDSIAFFRTDLEGEALAGFGTFEFERTVWAQIDGMDFAWKWPHPQPMWATGDSSFYYVQPPGNEVLVFGPGGDLTRRIRVRAEAPSWTREELYPQRRVDVGGSGIDSTARARMWSHMRDSELPDTFPVFADIALDDTGWLWLQEFRPAASRVPGVARWFVFDPEGVLQFSVRGTRKMAGSWSRSGNSPAISQDRILTVTTDELGVERVTVHRLRRNP